MSDQPNLVPLTPEDHAAARRIAREILDRQRTQYEGRPLQRGELLAAALEHADARVAELEALLRRVLMWSPRSTEAACEQDYSDARAFLARIDAALRGEETKP